ncbi:MAG: hypothetical protein JOZ20_02300, partial [Sphingomonas sp.]|nr:hypothetical protein [Sphingomonas sp.]
MKYCSMLLSSAALLFPASPLLGQQAAAPADATAAAPRQTTPVTPSAAPSAQPTDDTGDEEEIVITGAKPGGSVVGDIPPENTLDARDVRATG